MPKTYDAGNGRRVTVPEPERRRAMTDRDAALAQAINELIEAAQLHGFSGDYNVAFRVDAGKTRVLQLFADALCEQAEARPADRTEVEADRGALFLRWLDTVGPSRRPDLTLTEAFEAGMRAALARLAGDAR
jgi:hypothetical protein